MTPDFPIYQDDLDTDGAQSSQVPAAPRPRPVITVAHASVGSGHRAAALAIAQAIDHLRGGRGVPQNVEVEVVDILDFGSVRFDGNKAASAFTGVSRPIYDVTWRYTFTGRLLWGGGSAWSSVMFRPFNDYIESRRPIAVICTHITAANAAVGARMMTGVDFPLICVPTDYEIEGLWPHKETDLFCVATEFMAETLRPRKVPERCIEVTGIPVRPGFSEVRDRMQDCAAFGLPCDKTLVLVMAGATLPQPYVRFRAAMEETFPYLRSFTDMHFVFLPGKDIAYAKHLRSVFDGMKLSNTTVLDYVDDMAALMRTCDLAILKSGGLTVTECLCAELPMILLGKSYGQEKSNTAMLTSFGASMHATTARELVMQLKHLHDNAEALHGLLVNASALRRPDAASDIVSSSMRLVGVPCERDRHFVEIYWGKKPAHAR